MEHVLQQLSDLHERVSCAIYCGRNFNYERDNAWSVQMTYRWDGVKAEVNETGPNLELTLTTAWNRMNGMILHGLGAGAMTPALDNFSPPPPAPVGLDDEIPF